MGAAGGAQAGVAADVPLALVVRDGVVAAARIFELCASIVRLGTLVDAIDIARGRQQDR